MWTLLRCLGRLRLRNPAWWAGLGAWTLFWFTVRRFAPVLLISANRDSGAVLYDLAYISALGGGLTALHEFERLEGAISRASTSWKVAALVVALGSAIGILLPISVMSVGIHPGQLVDVSASSWLNTAWMLAVSVLAVTAVGLSPLLRGVRTITFLVSVVVIQASRATTGTDQPVPSNFELVSGLLPIIGMCSIVALVVRRAGSHR